MESSSDSGGGNVDLREASSRGVEKEFPRFGEGKKEGFHALCPPSAGTAGGKTVLFAGGREGLRAITSRKETLGKTPFLCGEKRERGRVFFLGRRGLQFT